MSVNTLKQCRTQKPPKPETISSRSRDGGDAAYSSRSNREGKCDNQGRHQAEAEGCEENRPVCSTQTNKSLVSNIKANEADAAGDEASTSIIPLPPVENLTRSEESRKFYASKHHSLSRHFNFECNEAISIVQRREAQMINAYKATIYGQEKTLPDVSVGSMRPKKRKYQQDEGEDESINKRCRRIAELMIKIEEVYNTCVRLRSAEIL